MRGTFSGKVQIVNISDFIGHKVFWQLLNWLMSVHSCVSIKHDLYKQAEDWIWLTGAGLLTPSLDQPGMIDFFLILKVTILSF